MNQAAHNKLVSFIWSIADDCLRDVYVRGKYRDVILPMVVLRRLDSLLEGTKDKVLDEVKFQTDEMKFYRGAIERGELPELLGGVTPRHARRVSSSLLSKGVFTAAGPRSPLRLAFPAALAGRWMPKLFPDQ